MIACSPLRFLVATSLWVLTTGCGLLNSTGTHHLLYQDEAAFFRHCAEKGQVVSTFGERASCVAAEEVGACTAAAGFFTTREEEGPFLTRTSGRTVDTVARHPCADDELPVSAFAALVDLEDDVAFGHDWQKGEGPFDLGEDVQLLDDEGRGSRPVAWETAVTAPPTGDIVFDVTFRFCLDLLPETELALQALDERGHHSNPLCLPLP